ncbi:4402_t:CDS:2 [Ambispora leptoticha]|uniref:arginine--tRNA ligase n=1 Tax=Ambispora leptoticha TaxID=144679 RepID=A0A9N9EWL5_9GLOM|nr:4402_t:CDS:2 [Ambispora leptoticha]
MKSLSNIKEKGLNTFLQWELPDAVKADFALVLALSISHKIKKNPLEVAHEIVKATACFNLEYTITKQGYINFRFPTAYYQQFFIETLAKEGQNFCGEKKGLRLNLEYVSTNPTGYLHLAHFRHAVIGNTLANVYQFGGYEVIREYYINDRGGQITSLVSSVYHFYHQIQNVSLPNLKKIEYSGHSSQELAQKLIENAWQLLGYDPGKLQIILVQMVNLLTKEGQTERFSKRAGNTIELEETLRYLEIDQLKFFLLEKEPNQPLSINAELLKENKEKTRLYYIQYAYARCHQIFQKAFQKNMGKISSRIDLLKEQNEREIFNLLVRFPLVLENIRAENKPHHLIYYLYELARTWQVYYQNSIILESKTPELTAQKLLLVKNIQIILKLGLDLMGITAPNIM